MTLTHPETIWSQRHADTLNVLDHVTFAPLAMFGGLSPAIAQAGPANSTATSSSSGSATEKWYAEIEKKVRPGVTRQQAAVLVAKEQPQLQAAYIDEYRRQAARR